mmetsp:Transcript_7215/g.30719  ORF Transcript_7215/g.30719 Transcript_7215/m.30719 type:complete len:219 (+) Transcript_7215:34-690(+)
MGAGNAYLVFYNVAQFVGWGYILYQLVLNFANGYDPSTLWESVGCALMIFQNAAVLEIVHSLVGLVRSPVGTTLMQVFSRVVVTTIVCYNIPEARVDHNFAMIMFAWSVTEVVRYSFYAFNLVGRVPYPLVWMRYTFFYVLYPLGVSGEIWTIIIALPITIERNVLGMHDFGTPYILAGLFVVALLGYIPGFPMLYNYMRVQRRKVIGGAGSKKKKSQ